MYAPELKPETVKLRPELWTIRISSEIIINKGHKFKYVLKKIYCDRNYANN